MDNFFVRFLLAVLILIDFSIMSSYLYLHRYIAYLSDRMRMVAGQILISVVACQDLNFTHGFNVPLGIDFKGIWNVY